MLVAGNVAEDLVEGAWVPGGPSLYASHVARALGADVSLLTGMTPTFDRSEMAGMEVMALPAEHLPRYENRYDGAGNRSQLLHNPGEPIPNEAVRDAIARTNPDVVYLAPAFHELSRVSDITFAGLTGISIQGPLRACDGLNVVPASDSREAVRGLAGEGRWVFFSVEDGGTAKAARDLASHITSRGAFAILTDGHRGAEVFRPGMEPEEWPAIPARKTVDPTGAGDTFATAFLLLLAETHDETLAMRFALAASSLAVERRGVQNIPARGEVEARAELAGAA